MLEGGYCDIKNIHQRKQRKHCKIRLIYDSVQPVVLLVDLTNKVIDRVAILKNNQCQENSTTFHSLRIPPILNRVHKPYAN